MNIKVIIFGVENKISLEDGIEVLNNLNNNNRKIYWNLNNNKAEVNIYKENKFNEINLESYKGNEGKIIFILDYLNQERIHYINESLDNNYNFIFTGEIKENINLNEKIAYLPQIKNKEDLNISSLLFMLINNLIYEKSFIEEISNSYLILGESTSNPLGDIPLYLLKRFKEFQNLNLFKLEVFNSKEFNLQELTYLEDPLGEYIKDKRKLKIKQTLNNKNNKIYFVFIGKSEI